MKKLFTLFTTILLATSLFAADELAYSIVFGNNASSASSLLSTTKATTVISAGTDYVTAQPFTINSGNCYYGDTKTCIRIGKSQNSASLSIALSEAGQVTATKIVVNADNTGNKNTGAELNVNALGALTTKANDPDDYTFTFETATAITSLTLTSTASIRIYQIDVYIEEEVTTDPSIKLTPAAFDLSSNAAANQEVAIEFRNWGEVGVADADATLFSDAECTQNITLGGWVSNFAFNADYSKLTFDVAANEVEEARTAYIRVYILGEDAETESTAVIEVKQAAFSIAHDYKLTAFTDIEATDEVIITMKNDANNKVYALSSSNGNSSTPDAVLVSVANNTISSEPDEEIFWNIVKGENGEFVINLAGDATQWLYCISDSKGIRVGTNDSKNFKIDKNYIYNIAQDRHLGVYISGSDWRCYKPNSGAVADNISEETLGFYVRKMANPTALDNTLSAHKAVKTIVNGQLLITRDGKTYNVLGTAVK